MIAIVIRSLRILLAGTLTAVLVVAIYFALGPLARERPAVLPGTVHASLDRESCATCHAPIAAEWRESFHFRSVNGPFWARIRSDGFARLFQALRIPCMNCHAPATVLDVADGAHPVERSDRPELGVDCVSCHVSERGIVGPGRYVDTPHEVIPDGRFRDAALASTTICARCHEETTGACRTVTAWRRTQFAQEGVTCLHCHMPEVQAPLVEGGPARLRRSHRFWGDKSEAMLRKALNASISIRDGKATLRIVNDRVGHSLPASGMNWLLVRLEVRDDAGHLLEQTERAFGSRELIPGYLDFWPFLSITKIPYGETREIVVDLPAAHGQVTGEFRYRDWSPVKDRDVLFARIAQGY